MIESERFAELAILQMSENNSVFFGLFTKVMQPIWSLKEDKPEVFASVEKYLTDHGFKIAAKDYSRPWGGFFVLDETQAQKFGQLYFDF